MVAEWDWMPAESDGRKERESYRGLTSVSFPVPPTVLAAHTVSSSGPTLRTGLLGPLASS